MCIMRCPTFGGRVSVAAKAGITERRAKRMDGSEGVMSGSCKLHFDSVSKEIQEQLRATGVALVRMPDELRAAKQKQVGQKACRQYALPEFADNIVLLDTGHVKFDDPVFPSGSTAHHPRDGEVGFEDPYSVESGNSIRYLAMSPRSDALKVEGLDNLFCAGEKAGPLVGHTEAMMTGSLAGRNAVLWAVGKEPIVVPLSMALGDIIAAASDVLRGGDLSRKLRLLWSYVF